MSAIVVRPKLQAWARIAAYTWRTRSGFRDRAPPACRKNCVNPVQESTSIRTSASSTLGRPEVFPNLGEVLSARLLASSVGLNLVRADLELVRDKAGGRSRSCAQIARNEAEVAKCTKLKREPQAVCCPPPDGDEVSVGTRQRELL